jgi:hypothetical protein
VLREGKAVEKVGSKSEDVVDFLEVVLETVLVDIRES